MKLDLTGLHIEVTDAIKEFTEKKIQRLAKFFDEGTICHVTFSVHKDKKHVDIRIEYKGRTYLAEDNLEDLYDGIDNCITKIEGQARKAKTIIEKKKREGVSEDVLDKITLEEALSEEE